MGETDEEQLEGEGSVLLDKKEKIGELKSRLSFEGDKKYAGAAAGAAILAVLVAAFFTFQFPLENQQQQEEEEKITLTDYQKEYVDCPRKYLETCTEMSRLPTEPISYWKKEDGRLYLKLEDGRAIITTLPNSTSPGEFVTYMSAEQVSESSNSTRS